MKIIIYGTKYGSSRTYAHALGEKTGIEVISFEQVKDLNGYDTVIYIGSLYAGGVLGMKKTLGPMSMEPGKRLIIATVGLADPEDRENVDSIRNSIKKQLNKELYESAGIFHLRGSIDYSMLSFKHKTMMAMLYRKASSLPEEKKTADVKALIETYNKQVNFINFDSLQPLLDEIK